MPAEKVASRERTSLINTTIGTDLGVGRLVMHPVLCCSTVPFGKDSSKVRVALLNSEQHGSTRDILEGSFEDKSNKDSGGVSLRKVLFFCFGDDSNRRDARRSHPCEDRRDAETAH